MKALVLIISSFLWLSSAMANSPIWTIIDVRTPAEHVQGNIPEALLIDYKSVDFIEKVSKLDRDKSYKIYCRSGNRANLAIEAMKQLGFKKLENIGSLEEATRHMKELCQGKTSC